MIAQFNIPPTVICGAGAFSQLAAQAQRLGLTRVLLVTDAFMVKSGLGLRAEVNLREAGIASATFAGVQPDPSEQNVLDGLALYRESGAQGVVAVGGGSPIDCAKVIAMLATNPLPLRQYMGRNKVGQPGVPLIAIPTTAGTGSEVTKAAVITDPVNDVKMLLMDPRLVPTVALVDFELTMSMPATLTAAVGVDTLTHGIEAYVSRLASPMTDALALACIEKVGRHLETAWRDPGDRDAREGMMLAATQGGMAFANSSVCLVHGMSRPVGALFHVPHGISNAMLLPAVTRYSLPGATARYATVARTLGWANAGASDAAAAAALVPGLEALNRRLEIPRLGAYPGLTESRFFQVADKMAGDALASGSPGNNPVVPDAAAIVALYRDAW